MTSCAGSPPPPSSELFHFLPGTNAVTYSGNLPCADCTGQNVVITLFADGTFRLRWTRLGSTEEQREESYDLGKWYRPQDDGDRLALWGKQGLREFHVLEEDRLLVMGETATPADSASKRVLVRADEVDFIEGPMHLRGTYVTIKDEGGFTECLTEKRFPVAKEWDHFALDAAYLAESPEVGEPILMTLEGRFVWREVEESSTPKEHLLVEHFDRAWPNERCDSLSQGKNQ
jgi:copper homeostasis protein (lipoprotein)